MLSLKEVKASNRSGPYPKPVRGQIVAVGAQKPYTPTGSTESKMMAYFSIAQEDTWMRGTVYDSQRLRMIQPGGSVLLKNFVFRNGAVIINEKTVVGKTSNVAVNSAALNEAYAAVHPASVLADIAVLLTATGPSLWTVEAVLTKLALVHVAAQIVYAIQ